MSSTNSTGAAFLSSEVQEKFILQLPHKTTVQKWENRKEKEPFLLSSIQLFLYFLCISLFSIPTTVAPTEFTTTRIFISHFWIQYTPTAIHSSFISWLLHSRFTPFYGDSFLVFAFLEDKDVHPSFVSPEITKEMLERQNLP